MIEADLVVENIAELATPIGDVAAAGANQGRLRVVRDAAVAARDGRIVWVGPAAELNDVVGTTADAERVDACGGTVLPGFVDAHTHLPFAGWRETEFDERLRGATYSEIAARGGGILSTVEKTRRMSEATLTETVRLRLDRLLELGTTVVEAKSGYGLSVEHELKQLRALATASGDHPVDVVPTFLGAHTIPAELRERRGDYVDEIVERMLPAVCEQGLAEFADAFVDRHAFTADEARRVLLSAREHGLGARLHADQLADDGTAELAAELGASSADHLEHVSARGIDALARAGTCAVLLPAATHFLMMDVRPPGRRLIDAGVPVVVATDFNPGSCPCESMGAAVAFACLTAGLNVDEAITGATLNAAHSVGRAGDAGSIEPGKRADLVVHAMPNRYHLVYRFGTSRVHKVVAGGRLRISGRSASC